MKTYRLIKLTNNMVTPKPQILFIIERKRSFLSLSWWVQTTWEFNDFISAANCISILRGYKEWIDVEVVL